jgi:hypothetical protein
MLMCNCYTIDYTLSFNELVKQHDYWELEEQFIERFEQDYAKSLEGTRSRDVGGVVLYYKARKEVAFFDYENLVGSVYALGGLRASAVCDC